MKLLKVRNMNWCCHCVGDWSETVYEVKTDGSYTKTIKISEDLNPLYPDEIVSGEFSQIQFNELKELLSVFSGLQAHMNGCDGEGWEITLYGAHGKIIHRTTGYVCGVSVLESIAAIMP